MFRASRRCCWCAASAYVSAQLATIGQGWEVVLEVGAGTGGVYLLRWYWWRINAWSEISAMATALVMHAVRCTAGNRLAGSAPVVFAKTTLFTTAVTTVVWVAVTLLTPAEPDETVLRFYRKVRPHAAGWRRVAACPGPAGNAGSGDESVAWMLGCAMVYAALFGIGKFASGSIGGGICVWRLRCLRSVAVRRISRMRE